MEILYASSLSTIISSERRYMVMSPSPDSTVVPPSTNLSPAAYITIPRSVELTSWVFTGPNFCATIILHSFQFPNATGVTSSSMTTSEPFPWETVKSSS